MPRRHAEPATLTASRLRVSRSAGPRRRQVEPARHRHIRAEADPTRQVFGVEAKYPRHLAADVDGDAAKPSARRPAHPPHLCRSAAPRRVRAHAAGRAVHAAGPRAGDLAAGTLVDDPSGAREVRRTVAESQGVVRRRAARQLLWRSDAAHRLDSAHRADQPAFTAPSRVRKHAAPDLIEFVSPNPAS